MKSFLLSLTVALLLAAPALAETSFQFTVPGAQVPDDPSVNGMRLSLLYGKTKSVSGLDVGIPSFSETENSSGFAAIFGIHTISGKSSGLQGSLININSGTATGVNAAFINIMNEVVGGMNVGFLNVTQGNSNNELSGLAISDSANLQIGFVNVTGKLKGAQIGFLNFAENGFLPFFPFFNFPKK